MQAERIHRADGRTLQQQLLAAQMQIAGVGADLLRQAGRDVGAQLAAAAFVKVIMSSWFASTGWTGSVISPTTRSTNTRVLPEPAAAETSRLPPRAEMAAACAGVN